MNNTSETTYSINWKKAKELVLSGELIGYVPSNAKSPELARARQEGQIHNQGEYLISEDGKKLYKRRVPSAKVVYDLIAVSPK